MAAEPPKHQRHAGVPLLRDRQILPLQASDLTKHEGCHWPPSERARSGSTVFYRVSFPEELSDMRARIFCVAAEFLAAGEQRALVRL